MNYRSPEEDEEIPHIDRAVDQLGFDPRRFFDEPLLAGDDTAMDPVERMRGIIRGLDDKQSVASLLSVEKTLERGPRDEVIEMLQDRMAFLREHGERPDNLRTEWPHELPERYQPHDRDRRQADVYWVDEDEGERRPWSQRPTSPTVGRSFDDVQTEVATDGGDSR
ncbi:hypothetical protein [Halorussus marinus]|uniref:hypothetical protein n=1 Tax=Halorussus marinus TaxID=2505976 RepID=UPI0010925C23|nr:hypothetical protein [Halorussus marinus]